MTSPSTAALAFLLVAFTQPGPRDNKGHVKLGERMSLTATAYCRAGTTRSGTRARTGIVAADPRIIPEGSVLEIVTPGPYAGIYTVMDTGSAIKGRRLDIFVPSCEHAARFGKRSMAVRILRRGWNPRAVPSGPMTSGLP